MLFKNSLTFFLSILLSIYGSFSGFGQNSVYKPLNEDQLPYGNSYLKWEKSQRYSKTYFVAQTSPQASDENPGTEQRPFLTIGKAAEVLQPGERVIIKEGVYNETIRPARGGTAPDKMIVYEAAADENVVIKGSFTPDKNLWKKSQGWQVGRTEPYGDEKLESARVWQIDLYGMDFQGYNPFGMLNLMQDQEYLDYTKVNMKPHFQKRGWVIIDGILLEQVAKPVELMGKSDGAYWPEHNGMRIHVRFPDGKTPDNCTVELTNREQLFAPLEYGLGYIKIKGIHFLHAANGFPVPQRGVVSASRGHHWIIEDCIIEGANSLGVDLGNEMWNTIPEDIIGHHIFRRNTIKNCGIAGLQGMRGIHYLVEDNLFENIGWHNAEHGWESGAIKMHLSKHTMIRRNVFRNIKHAPGIWLDYLASQNCRITQNVFTGITSARGAVYIEVSRGMMSIDHNFFHNTRSQYWISGDYGAGGSALYTDGSDSIRFHHNFAYDIENSGFGGYANAARIVSGRGGTDRNHEVLHNVFIKCGKHGIEFPNVHNFADYNIYSQMPAGYLKIKNPAPELLLDLKAWQDYYGWEKNGKLIRNTEVNFDAETLTLTFDPEFLKGTEAGPFMQKNEFKQGINIDPRKP